MKILMLNYEFPPVGGGGGQAHLSLLRQYAGRSDLQVDVLTSAPQPQSSTEQFAPDIRIFKIGIHKKDLHFWRKGEVIEWLARSRSTYRKLVKEEGYDLVHAFFGFPSGWLCHGTARRLPYIISLRGSDVPGANARFRFEYKILGPIVFKPVWKKAAALVACSEGLRKRALNFLPSAHIEVIPNGVDLDRFRPASSKPTKERMGVDGRTLRLLTVGRLSTTKRLPVLIETMESLRGGGCDVQLTIVGGGALQDDLRQAIQDKGLQDAIHITGRCEGQEMPEVYRAHDVFISASAQEGMSNAMLEAMASGLPIVTTRCEGVDELICDNGLVVDAPQPQELARAVGVLANDAQAWSAMSIAARRRAERFTWHRVAHSYLQLYARVI